LPRRVAAISQFRDSENFSEYATTSNSDTDFNPKNSNQFSVAVAFKSIANECGHGSQLCRSARELELELELELIGTDHPDLNSTN
jgi:hypothetical protein